MAWSQYDCKQCRSKIQDTFKQFWYERTLLVCREKGSTDHQILLGSITDNTSETFLSSISPRPHKYSWTNGQHFPHQILSNFVESFPSKPLQVPRGDRLHINSLGWSLNLLWKDGKSPNTMVYLETLSKQCCKPRLVVFIQMPHCTGEGGERECFLLHQRSEKMN